MELSGKKFAVYGIGRSGLAAIRYLLTKGVKPLVINYGSVNDWSKELIRLGVNLTDCFSEELGIDKLKACDFVVMSPGIEPNKVPEGPVLLAEMDLCFHELKNTKIIGITGSNGKTTTTSLITHILKNANFNALYAGNIGVPYCELALEGKFTNLEYLITELSSFQLEIVKELKLDYGIWTNLILSHTERYKGLDDYAAAKLKIINLLKDSNNLIYHKDIDYIDPQLPNSFNLAQAKSYIDEYYNLEGFLLPGDHNLENAYMAIKVLEHFKIDRNSIESGLVSFKGVPHRLELIFKDQKIQVFNDSKSTNSVATMKALEAFDNQEILLILGGRPRSNDATLGELIPLIQKKVKLCLLFGEAKEYCSKELAGVVPSYKFETLDKLVNSKEFKKHKGIIVFSPAHPSFDQYKNFEERGEDFKELINGP